VTESRTVEGRVNRDTYAAGTKGEHSALILTATDGSRYLLRRLGGPAYADPDLDPLEGHRVSVTGLIHRDVFLIEDWRVL
jgi:hypothetical protein